MNIYAAFDRKMRQFDRLVLVQNDETLIRSLSSLPDSGDSDMVKYPEDFDIFCLGAIDVESGVIVREDAPRLVVNLGDLKRRNNG